MLFKKRKTIFLGSVLFFGSIWFMTSRLDTSTKRTEKETNAELKTLQSKLVMVEKKLQFNKYAMHDVHNSVESLLKLRNVHNSKDRKDLETILKRAKNEFPMHKPAGNVSRRFEDTCPVMSYEISHSDVSMLNIYGTLSFENKDGGVWKQGYPIQTSDSEWAGKKLKVFVVPHSHNDPGWIKTVDRYFQDQTRHILDNIVDALSQDERRKFIWAEMSYLSMWWNVASPDRKLKMKRLVDNGQLEMVTAGWVMNDEANTHYFAMVDQMIEGNEWLFHTLGVTPKSGWAIDPFGHSSTMAYILKKMNFKNMLIQRVHYAVKKHLSLQKALEFRWRQSWATDQSTDILCHMMPFYSYDIPHTCGPDPKICCQFDFARLPGRGSRYSCPWGVPPVAINDANVGHRSAMLLDQYRKKSKLFKSNTLLIVLGDDFRYSAVQETTSQYENYAKIFAYVNSHPELHAELKFGTLSDYFDAMTSEMGGRDQLPALTGDFFTYADRDDHYWSGYYVSRPFHKMQERVLESHLRGAEILFSLALPVAKSSDIWSAFTRELYPLLVQARRNLGLFQHHDGITGTAKDHVVVDYGNKLQQSVVDSKKIMLASAEVLLSRDPSTSFDANSHLFDYDEIYKAQNEPPQRKVVTVPPSEASATVVIYNSLPYTRTGVVCVLVSAPEVSVANGHGDVIASQTNPVWTNGLQTERDHFEVFFLATVPGTGLATYTIRAGNKHGKNSVAEINIYNGPLRATEPRGPFQVKPSFKTDDINLDNDHIIASFSSQSGFMQHVTDKHSGVRTQVAIDFAFYTSRSSKDRSGAYLFLPSGPARPHVGPDHRPLIKVMAGPIVSSVQVDLPNVVHTASLYHGDKRSVQPLGVHVSNRVDVRRAYDNKEIAMRLTSDVLSGKNFYTDLNGFEVHHRTTYDKLPLQANFYPMPAMAYIQDRKTRLSLLTGQPLGVASLRSGQLEVIMDRRLMQDDNRGLGQGVRDNVLTPENFVILVEKWGKDSGGEKASTSMSYPSLSSHRLSWELLNPTRSMALLDPRKSKVSLRSEHAPLASSHWPNDVHLLNLRSIQAPDSEEPTEQSALLLHRVGRECTLDSDRHLQLSDDPAGPNRSFDIPVTSFFTPRDVCVTSLSLQGKCKALSLGSRVTVNPMEIEALKIKLV